MNRKELLIEAKEGKTNAVSEILEMDSTFLKRTIRTLNDQIEDKERELTRRMRADEPIDASVVEVLYGSLSTLKAKIELYEAFQKQYYA